MHIRFHLISGLTVMTEASEKDAEKVRGWMRKKKGIFTITGKTRDQMIDRRSVAVVEIRHDSNEQ